MLVKVPLLKNGIEKLHEEISYFISRIQNAKRWSRNLFQTDFYNQVVSQNPKLEKRLRNFFKEFNKLPLNRKNEIIQEFTNYNAVRDLCSDVSSVSRYWQDPIYPAFSKATKDLFIFMYEETLGRASYRSFSGESLKDHYNMYRLTFNLSMCPFCGLEDYKDLHDELTTRDAYDHYLDKARYPFAAVNIDNLFPMCHECNSSSKKTQDILHESGTGARRLAPYPPDDEFQILIQINNALSLSPNVSVTLYDASDLTILEKFTTWLIVFQIRQRYEGRVKKKKQDWLADSVGKLSLVTIDADLPQRLKTAHERCLDSVEVLQQSNNHLKAAFLAYCIAHSTSIVGFFRHDSSYARYLTDRAKVLK